MKPIFVRDNLLSFVSLFQMFFLFRLFWPFCSKSETICVFFRFGCFPCSEAGIKMSVFGWKKKKNYERTSLRGQTVHWIGALVCVFKILDFRDKSLNMLKFCRKKEMREQKKNKGSVFVAESAYNSQNAQFCLLMMSQTSALKMNHTFLVNYLRNANYGCLFKPVIKNFCMDSITYFLFQI